MDATEAVLALQQLKARYGELVDRRFERGRVIDAPLLDALASEIAALFTEDAEWDGGHTLGVARGRSAIAERLRRPSLDFSWHISPKPPGPPSTASKPGDGGTSCARAGAPTDLLLDVRIRGRRVPPGRKVSWLHRRMKLTTVFMASADGGWGRLWH